MQKKLKSSINWFLCNTMSPYHQFSGSHATPYQRPEGFPESFQKEINEKVDCRVEQQKGDGKESQRLQGRSSSSTDGQQQVDLLHDGGHVAETIDDSHGSHQRREVIEASEPIDPEKDEPR